MNSFKKVLKEIKSLFTVLIVNNKNGKKCIVIPGLDAREQALLAPELQNLIAKARNVDGLGASYTPPHKSSTGEGLLYFGPQNAIKDDDIDAFEVE